MTTTESAAPAPTRRGRIRQAQILRAALRLFAQSGYSTVSLRDIAAASGITHPGVLRHFRSKADILDALLADLERSGLAAFADTEAGERHAALVQRWNDDDPDRSGLFTMLNGEAGPAGHPAHQRIGIRYRRVRTSIVDELNVRREQGRLRAEADPEAAAVRLIAGWDGLSLLARYRRLDIVAALERYERQLAAWPAATAPPEPPGAGDPGLLSGLVAATTTAEVERLRRDRIVAEALALFAESGYSSTSMQDIADRVGLSKAAMFHHYPSKTDLLRAVLVLRDAEVGDGVDGAAEASAEHLLRDVVHGARRNSAQRPGLIEVYAVLSCEASIASHPAHRYFAERFERAITFFAEVFRAAARDGVLRPGLDPDAEALWFVALWDGLQLQWMYDRDGIRIDEHLGAHLDDVLVRPSG